MSSNRCVACQRERGFIYTGPVYCLDSLEGCLCPWCIADGSAAARFDAIFTDDHSLRSSGMPAAVIDEVTRRTPGYVSWQSEVWLTHCEDACEFHGDLPAERLDDMDPQGKAELSGEERMTEDNWRALRETYAPAGQPAIYVFVCRHCRRELYHMDYT